MKHVDQRIQAYCDGELGAAERAAFEEHVRQCGACRGQLEAVQRLWAVVESAAEAVAPGAVWPAVSARVSGRGRPSSWSWTQRGLAVAAMLAGVAIGFGIGGIVPSDSADRDADTASADYLEQSLPTLDQLWLQLGDSSEETGS